MILRMPLFGCLAALTFLTIGCEKSDPIEIYTIPTEMPAELRPGAERMLAAMIPGDKETWFLKVSGPEAAIAEIDDDFRSVVQSLTFVDGNPDLSQLPEGWRMGAKRPMRFASIDVDTAERQLDISVSSLPKQEDWDQEVLLNVNRWRGQVGLPESNEKWAAAEPMELASLDQSDDQPAVWVDITGTANQASSSSMMAPSGSRLPGSAAMPSSSPRQPPSGEASGGSGAGESAAAGPPKLQFDKPEGWREGRMSSMRLAAFNVGPEDAEAEITVIPAGGDLRGNVQRWLEQIRPEGVAEAVVDEALEKADKIDVDGRSGQRFLLTGANPEAGTAIDATIVPIEEGFSLFIKMTGPVSTVKAESEATRAFLESLKL